MMVTPVVLVPVLPVLPVVLGRIAVIDRRRVHHGRRRRGDHDRRADGRAGVQRESRRVDRDLSGCRRDQRATGQQHGRKYGGSHLRDLLRVVSTVLPRKGYGGSAIAQDATWAFFAYTLPCHRTVADEC